MIYAITQIVPASNDGSKYLSAELKRIIPSTNRDRSGQVIICSNLINILCDLTLSPEDSCKAGITTDLRALAKVKDIHHALHLLNRIKGAETALLSTYSYSNLELVDSISNTLSWRIKCDLSDGDAAYRKPQTLSNDTQGFLEKTGFKDFVENNVDNIFFIPDGHQYPNIFPYKETQLASMEYFSRSVFINSDISSLSPIVQAATLVHEACHIITFAKYKIVYSGEKEAFKTELDYWKRLASDKENLSEQDRLIVYANIADIEKRISSGRFF